MTLTTPPPPLDVEAAFPELVGKARTTVRLHPRPGRPDVRDSSLGGPLLWPADEPWPGCPAPAEHEEVDEPVPTVVAVLQIFARDVPELPFPDGADVLQVLWCPGTHEMNDYLPMPVVRWRETASVTGPLVEAPTVSPGAEGVEAEFLPRPCVLNPERVSEYPDGWELDDDLRERVQNQGAAEGWDYFYHLGAAPGIKVGGWPNWIQDPWYPACDGCGRPMGHLLTIASWEYDGESWRRWLPAEELPVERRGEGRSAELSGQSNEPTGLMLADAGSMYLLVCEHCPDRPVKPVSQSS